MISRPLRWRISVRAHCTAKSGPNSRANIYLKFAIAVSAIARSDSQWNDLAIPYWLALVEPARYRGVERFALQRCSHGARAGQY